MEKLALQRLAMSAYHPDFYPPGLLTEDSVEEDGALDGDTLAQFIWREVGAADGHPEDATRMLECARDELGRVISALHMAEPLESFDQTQALAEGWCLMNGRDIQRNDEVLRFANDAEAELFVHHQAASGSAYHAQALRQITALYRS